MFCLWSERGEIAFPCCRLVSPEFSYTVFHGESDEEVIGGRNCSEFVEGWTTDNDVISREAVDYKELHRGSYLFWVCPGLDSEGDYS